MAGGGSPLKVVVTALLVNGGITILKFIAFAFTASSAMLAEAFHSVADTGNQALMILGLKRAERPPDQTHPYGYGKETYFWSFVVAMTMFTLGATVALYEAVHKFIEIASGHSAPVGDQTWGYVVLAVAIVLEGYGFFVAYSEYRKDMGDRTFRQAIKANRATATITVLFEDGAAVIGLFLALFGTLAADITQNPFWDALATLAIGIVLAAVAIFLSYMSKRLLIGQSANEEDEASMYDAIDGSPGVVKILELKTLHMGRNYILLNLGIQFADGLDVQRLEATIDSIERRVKAAVPTVRRIFIEADSLKKGSVDGPDQADSRPEHEPDGVAEPRPE